MNFIKKIVAFLFNRKRNINQDCLFETGAVVVDTMGTYFCIHAVEGHHKPGLNGMLRSFNIHPTLKYVYYRYDDDDLYCHVFYRQIKRMKKCFRYPDEVVVYIAPGASKLFSLPIKNKVADDPFVTSLIDYFDSDSINKEEEFELNLIDPYSEWNEKYPE